MSLAALLFTLGVDQNLRAETVTYSPDGSLILNPERGLTKLMTVGDASIPTIQGLRADNHTIAWGLIRLDSYRTVATLPTSKIDEIKRWMDAVRADRVKAVLRIVYHEVATFTPPEAAISIQEAHLDQLGTEIFLPYEDLIIALQAGGIGAYGEWYFAPPAFTTTATRKQLLDKMFDVISPDSFVMVRTPYYKQEYDAAGATADRVFRTSHYNDCFLSSADDTGTYACYPWPGSCPTITQLKDYVAIDSAVVPIGGETCNDNFLNDCSNTLTEMDYLGFSFINTLWFSSIRSKWQSQGCFNEIATKLGYRFELVSATVPDNIQEGQDFTVSVTIKNTGYAQMYYSRPVYIRMMDDTNSEIVYYWTGADPRSWLSGGGNYTFSNTFTAPATLNTSSVSLSLWMPDNLPANYGFPEYSVQCANIGVWDSTNGNNLLKSGIPVGSGGGPGNGTFLTPVIDGNVSEWPAGALVWSDAQGDNNGAPSDIKEVYLANDNDYIYLRVDTWNSHDYIAFFNNTYFDGDENSGTGFAPHGLSFGSSMLLQGAGIYSQAGGGFNEGTCSSPGGNTVTVAPGSGTSATAWEWRVPRDAQHPGGAAVFSQPNGAFNLFVTSDNAGFAEGAPNNVATESINYIPATSGGGGSSFIVLTSDDFESGWGNYTDGGNDCYRYTGGTHAHQGNAAAAIQDNSCVASSFTLTNGLNLDGPGYTELKVDFWYKPVSMDNSNEDFWLQYWDGTAWYTIETWARNTDFQNNQFYQESVTLLESQALFPTDAKIRFRCDASGNADDVYIDEIIISAK
jgi:hypothetical protein